MYYIGIDIGGTFTDLVTVDELGNLSVHKVETTPQDLTEGLMNALALSAQDRGLSLERFLSQVAYFAHATTTATNALIQRRGVKTGLITTKGFRDTIFIQRMMGVAAGLSVEETRHFSRRSAPAPLVIPPMVAEVTERVDYKGAVVVPLDREEARRAVRNLIESGARAIAICLLWSFQNPAHEQEIKKVAREEAPDVFTCASSDLLPLMKEYERTATTLVNAYLSPITARYINNLEGSLREKGFRGTLSIMNSLGGVSLPKDAAVRAVELLSSGPAGGVLGSISLGKVLGFPNIIATDMGGTSFDAGLIANSQPTVATVSEVARYHLTMPMIEIISIGAGGGSLCRVDKGQLTVGPQSAGARPGPVCYRKGGTEPTVTDADVVLGYLDPDRFLGGRIKLDREAAAAAIQQKIADPLGIGLLEAASGIRSITDNYMSDLLRTLTVERGHDPSDFVIFAYGGAGPTHCCAYSHDLQVQAIVVPFTATAHSAFGAVGSDLHHTFQMSDSMHTPPYFQKASQHLDVDRINRNLNELAGRGTAALKTDGVAEDHMTLLFRVAMRYRRQVHELEVPLPSPLLDAEGVDAAVERFGRIYEERYGKDTGFREAGVEWSYFKVEALGQIARPKLKMHPMVSKDPSQALTGKKSIFSGDTKTMVVTRIFDGNRIEPGNIIEGPAIIQQQGTTIVVSPEYAATVDQYLNVIIRHASNS